MRMNRLIAAVLSTVPAGVHRSIFEGVDTDTDELRLKRNTAVRRIADFCMMTSPTMDMSDMRQVTAMALQLEEMLRLRPLGEWRGSSFGQVLWWRVPIREPPYVSSPLSSDWMLSCDGGKSCMSKSELAERDELDRIDKDENGDDIPWATHFSIIPYASRPNALCAVRSA